MKKLYCYLHAYLFYLSQNIDSLGNEVLKMILAIFGRHFMSQILIGEN